MTLPLVAILSAGAAWAELALALKWSVDSQYLVSGLPFAPVANFGLLGAQVALCYLVTLIPDDRLGKWRGVLVKLVWRPHFISCNAGVDNARGSCLALSPPQ